MSVNTIKATIQMRRGLEQEFDADQMTAGEWAVSTDTKYVRMCFAPGIALRMATYEGFEKDMKEVQKILKECQDIQAAVDTMANLAEQHKNDSAASAKLSESWAKGDTGIRFGENANNSKYFSDLAKTLIGEAEKLLDQAQKIVAAATSGALIPAGTITFSNLPESPMVGYMYNISDDFTTDSRFEDGAGIFYRAGANVYWTSGGKWDVLVGTQVTGVKGDSEHTYRIGNVNITADNVGALSKNGGTITNDSGYALDIGASGLNGNSEGHIRDFDDINCKSFKSNTIQVNNTLFINSEDSDSRYVRSENILNTYEEISANVYEQYVAGALGVMDVFRNLFSKKNIYAGPRWGRIITNNKSVIYGNLIFVDFMLDIYYGSGSFQMIATFNGISGATTTGNVVALKTTGPDDDSSIVNTISYPLATFDFYDANGTFEGISIGIFQSMTNVGTIQNVHVVGVIPILSTNIV